VPSSEAAQAHHNLLEYGRWTIGLDDGAHLLDADGVLALAFSYDWPSTRQAVCSDDAVPAERWVSAGDDFLAAHGTMACVFVREGVDDEAESLLLSRGYQEHGRVPSMLCDVIPEDRSPSPGVTVRLAESAEDVLAYAAVAGKAFVDLMLPEEPTRRLLERPQQLLADDVVVAVGELDGAIVAGAFAKLTDGGASGYVSFVSALAEARGHALGDAVTRRVTREAFQRGAASLSLEASAYGANTYRRMGYRDLFEYRLMIRLGLPEPDGAPTSG
jgi:ribosomal protein S18 acetylase RimI-like enzyme